ncbi:MAG: hypothetical protein ABII12_00450 [Planctomycetota bacterium]
MARSSDAQKLSLWRGRFRRFLDSGLSVARFCTAEGLSESSFYYWQKKLRPQARRRVARAHGRGGGTAGSGTGRSDTGERDGCGRVGGRGVFRPVTVVPATRDVVIQLPGGTRIEVDAHRLEALRAIVAEMIRFDHDQAARPRTFADNRIVRQRNGTASC